jgi:Tfp pilus assembly protein PilW
VAAVTAPGAGERGLTLTEVAVVMILGTMIMAGLVGFYLSSQGLWLDASTQAITQREAALVTAAMRDSIRKSGKAVVTAAPDSLHEQLALFNKPTDVIPSYYFWWNSADSLLYAGTSVGGAGSGPMIVSHAERFQMLASAAAVRVDLRLRTASGDAVESSAYAVMKNR